MPLFINEGICSLAMERKEMTSGRISSEWKEGVGALFESKILSLACLDL